MSLEKYFKQGIIVERSSQVSNGMGGYTESWIMHDVISGLIDSISGKESKIAAKYQKSATHILICDVGNDITESDRINDDGKIYRILFVDEPFSRQAEILLEYVGVDNE